MKATTMLSLLNDLDAAVPTIGGYLDRMEVPQVTEFQFIMNYSNPRPVMPQIRRTFIHCCEGCGQRILGTEWFQGVMTKFGVPSDKVAAKFNNEDRCTIRGETVILAIAEVIDEEGL